MSEQLDLVVFGRQLKVRRRALYLTQEDLARAAYVSPAYISRLETCSVTWRPGPAILRSIREALDRAEQAAEGVMA